MADEIVETEEDKIKPVELIVVRGTVVEGKDVKRGDKIKVPAKNKHKGVYPVRWWVANKKAARNKAEFDEFCEAVDLGKQNQTAPGPEK